MFAFIIGALITWIVIVIFIAFFKVAVVIVTFPFFFAMELVKGLQR